MQKQLSGVRQVFLDMDGTIYHGGKIFPTTIPFLDFLKARGIGYTFLTNNSSYSIDEYIARLAKFGIRTTAENFYISADYTIDYLKRHHPEMRKLFILGMPCLDQTFVDAGFRIDNEEPDAVIVSFDRELTYRKLCRAAWFLRQGVPGFATHPDVFCPTDQEDWLVDCGAMTACLESATNVKIKVLGKPDPGMLVEAAARKKVSVDQVMMIGDRLATDIALGQNAGAVTCHIFTPGADLIIPENVKADYTVKHLGELQQIWIEQEK